MRVAYLTNQYPSVSHTFIRRELTELERQVGEVARFTIRESSFKIVDEDDQRELDKTFPVLKQPKSRWVKTLLRTGLGKLPQSLHGLRKAFSLGVGSQSGLPKHMIYFVEALLLLEEMKARGIDHLHVHFGTNPAAVAQIMRAMGGPQYSFTVHGPDELDAPKSLSLGSKITDAAFVVAITSFCAGQLRRWVDHEHWDKIKVVHCTVGDEFFDQATPIDPESKTFVCVGRLSAQKGQLLLVEAFALAIEDGVDANLVLCGDGEMRGEIESLIKRYNIEDRVRITGWISGEQVRKELLASRCLALPSFAEGLPMVIMEAFALQRPVLTTYIAGIPELVVDGENGFLIVSGNKEAIREGIKRVMATPLEKLSAMGKAGCEAVKREHYTPIETAKLIEQIKTTLARNAR
ncbi:MAG: glycosyltransferase family 4 protein [Nannocystaceae bacterium]|nr:glycosyltransferase family 4 protein [Nannocystaceae bacterium]